MTIAKLAGLNVDQSVMDDVIECRLARPNGEHWAQSCEVHYFPDLVDEENRPLAMVFYALEGQPAMLPIPASADCMRAMARNLPEGQRALFKEADEFLRAMWWLTNRNQNGERFELSAFGQYTCAAGTPWGHVSPLCPQGPKPEDSLWKNPNRKVKKGSHFERGANELFLYVLVRDSFVPEADEEVIGAPCMYALKAASTAFKEIKGYRVAGTDRVDYRLVKARELEFKQLGSLTGPMKADKARMDAQLAVKSLIADAYVQGGVEVVEVEPEKATAETAPPAQPEAEPVTRRRRRTSLTNTEVTEASSQTEASNNGTSSKPSKPKAAGKKS